MPRRTFSCVSWNVHRGRGNDGRVDARRTLDVLRQEVWRPEADALFLQEADEEQAPFRGVLDVDAIETVTGLRHAHKQAGSRSTEESHGFLGVTVYLHPRFEIEDLRLVDLPGVCPRGATVVDVAFDDMRVRLVNTHLSLSQPLRLVQLRTLRQHLDRFEPRQTVLCGDFNEWRPWGGAAFSKLGLGNGYAGPARGTFPIGRPVLPLDRVLTHSPARVDAVEVLDGPGIRMASDHRPIFARVSLGP